MTRRRFECALDAYPSLKILAALVWSATYYGFIVPIVFLIFAVPIFFALAYPADWFGKSNLGALCGLAYLCVAGAARFARSYVDNNR